MSVILACDGEISEGTFGAARCSGQWQTYDYSTFLTKFDDVLTRFDLSQLDPELIAMAFGAGFVPYAVFRLSAISVQAIISAVK